MAWLYVPGLADLSSASGSYSPITAPSVTWRGKPLPPRGWSRVWQTAPWLRRLSGTTYSASTADAGVVAWISSRLASPANRGARPAPAAGLTMIAGSGLTSRELLATYDPTSCSLKTSRPSLFEADSPSSSLTLPVSVSMSKGRVYRPATSAPPIDASGSFYWPSPLASDVNGARPEDGRRSTGLNTHAADWPTPAARDYRHPNSAESQERRNYQGGDQLPNYVAHLWATPRTEDGESSGNHPGASDSLTGQTRMWPTPKAEPYGSSQNGINGKGGAHERPSAGTPSLERLSHSFLPLLATSTPGEPSSPNDPTLPPRSVWATPRTQCNVTSEKAREEYSSPPGLAQQAVGSLSLKGKAKLNPNFVEWLMGWPIGWTASELAVTEWSHWQRRMRSSLWQLAPGSGRTE